MIAVCRKELRSYRISMIGYVFVAFMLAVVSLYFAYQNLNLASPRFWQRRKNRKQTSYYLHCQ